jgi:hypothetical protein
MRRMIQIESTELAGAPWMNMEVQIVTEGAR